MSYVRAFVAIELPIEIKQAIRSVADRMLARLPGFTIKSVRDAHIHLTLLFLGDVLQADLPKIKMNLGQVASKFGPFDLDVAGAGVFPDYKKPRVIWLGINEVGVGEIRVLPELQTQIWAAIERVGVGVKQQKFNPHLTIGRVNQNILQTDLNQIGEVVKSENVGFLGVMHVNQFHLIRSELTPSGPIYTNLATFGLGNQSKKKNINLKEV